MTFVYVIAAEGGPVKIGIANDPKWRLRTLSTGTPFRLRLAHIEDPEELAAAKIEKVAHALLAAARTHGEWFAVTVDEAKSAIREAIADLRRQPPNPLPHASPVGFEEQVKEVREAIIASQCRAARSLLDWTQPQLVRAAGVSLSTVVDFEKERRFVSAEAAGKMRTALEAAGVIFIETNGEGPGVRLRKAAP